MQLAQAQLSHPAPVCLGSKLPTAIRTGGAFCSIIKPTTLRPEFDWMGSDDGCLDAPDILPRGSVQALTWTCSRTGEEVYIPTANVGRPE